MKKKENKLWLQIFLAAFFHVSVGGSPCTETSAFLFIGACEINISSCHLNCVLLWFYAILTLHNVTTWKHIFEFISFHDALQQKSQFQKINHWIFVVSILFFLSLWNLSKRHEYQHSTARRRKSMVFCALNRQIIPLNVCKSGGIVGWSNWTEFGLLHTEHSMHFALVTVNQQAVPMYSFTIHGSNAGPFGTAVK